MSVDLDNSSTVTGDASFSSTGNQNPPPKKKRNLPGMPDPDAEVIALSPKTLMATNRFFCEICNQGFQRDQNLQLHRRGHNLPWKLRQRSSNEVRKKVYVCPVSGCVHHEPSRGLGDLTGIKKHFCRKHGEKKWKCEKCSKKYAVQSDWKAHSKICGTKEYKCDCGTLFSRRDIFITHRAFCDALAEESAKNHTQSKKLYPETVIKRKNTEPDHKSPSTVDSPPPPPPPPPQSQQPHSPPSVALAPVPAISVETESVKITSSSVLPIQSSPVYRKHYPPYPDSEVWRLDNIAKNRLLAQAGIHTVKDLRRYLAVHSNTFPQILEGKISEERWNAIVSHSMDCVLDEKECYIYNSKAHGAFLLFNSVYEVMKVSFDGITVLNTTDLTSTQQETLGMLKREAYENVDCFVAADFLNFLQRSSSSLQDAELSICVPKPQGIILDEESDFSELSGSIDVYEPLDTCVASSASLDYDVVIRYRRGDVSNDDFISHLRAALCRRGISVHEDFDEVDGAPECRVLILFITSSYVPSNLLNILEHQQIESQVVYPLFYGMSPSDLISNSKNYERFFLQDEPKWWQAALKEIAQMPGYILTDKSESELIDEIVRDTSKVLCSIDKENMMGMDMQIKEIMSLLCIESPDVRSIGLWGTVGIGKTAIAEEIFCRISVQYESCVFLNDLHKEVEAKGQDALREDFLSKVLEVEPLVIRFSDIKASFLRSRLQSKKVLVILDNVNDFRDVETFLGKLKYFGPGSRVIITSRNRHVFVQCKIDNVYEVKPLDLSNSLLLLESGTFRSVLSPRPNRALSLELVRFSSGNPRVLQFFSESVKEWKRLSQQIQKSSPIYIEDIFERCCCGLDDNERSIFLDIACFFRKMDKDDVAMLLDGCGFSARVGFRSLVDKSLLTISHDVLGMLRFIQATGREIVRQESQWPEYCSRLWDPEDIMDVFIHNKGTSTIEGIFLDMSRLKFDANPNIFEKMCNLRLLKIYSSGVMENTEVSLPQGLEYLPSKLRLLHWEYYPLSSLPRSFDPKNLVELNLPSSCAKKLWKGKKSLEKLRKMRLSYSYQLTKIPRLSNSPNLEHIDLEGCNSLVSISQSISSLKKLVFLNLKDCSKLESIPSTVDLEALEVLNLSGCSKVENYPEVSPNVKELYLGGTMIQEIPSSIKNLVLLEKLDLENSRHLVNLPMSICKLKNLETLNLSGCTSLERFPDLSRRMKSLKSLDLSRTAIRELPSSISYLTALEELRFVDCRNLVKLPDNVWSLRFKVEFRQIDTEKFSRLWNRLGWLKKVQIS